MASLSIPAPQDLVDTHQPFLEALQAGLRPQTETQALDARAGGRGKVLRGHDGEAAALGIGREFIGPPRLRQGEPDVEPPEPFLDSVGPEQHRSKKSRPKGGFS